MPETLSSLRAYPLTARFADLYGGEDRIPPEVARPSSHFQSIRRTGQYCTIVVCEASDGTIGYGECFGLPTPYPAAEIVNRVAADALIGKPLGRPADMTTELRRFFLALGHSRGPAMEALSGIDIALWDLAARQQGVPLASALGTRPRAVATYASPVPFLPSPQQSAAAAKALQRGFNAIKLKVGRSAREDIPHITAVREAIGPDVALMLDANCGYSLDDAKDLVREIEPLDIRWLEEPLPPDDTAAARALADSTAIPLAGGENEFTAEAIAALITEAGVKIVQPNVSRAGGVSGLLATDRLAGDLGARVAPHGVGGCIVVATTVHAAAAMDRFDLFEVNRLPNPLRDDLGSRCTFTADGSARPPDGPGHGSPVAERLEVYADPLVRAAE